MSRLFNWSRFSLGVYVDTSPTRVYKTLATAGGLEKWFPNVARFASKAGTVRKRNELTRKGDAYYKWFIYAGGVEGTGKVLDARKDRLLKMTFGTNGQITFTLRRQGSGTLVELTQDRIPTTPKARIDSHMGCRTGWTFFLTNLKSVLEGGPDLRETDPKRAKDIALVNM